MMGILQTVFLSILLGSVGISLALALFRWRPLRARDIRTLTYVIIAISIGSYTWLLTESFAVFVGSLVASLIGTNLIWRQFYGRQFDVLPLAYARLVEKMPEAILIIDNSNHIVDMNPKAEVILGVSQLDGVKKPLAHYGLGSSLLTMLDQAAQEITGQDGKTYQVRVTVLQEIGLNHNGRFFTFSDISKQKQAEQAQQEQKQFFETMARIAQIISSSNELETTLQNILDVAFSLSQAHYGSLYVLDPYHQVTHQITTQSDSVAQVEQTFDPILVSEGLMGWVLRHQKLAIVDDTETDDRWLKLSDWSVKACSVIAVPIADTERVLSVIVLLHEQVAGFTQQQATLLQNTTNQMGLAIRNAQLYEMQRLSARRQATLYQLLRGMGQHLDLQAVAQEAVKQIQKHTNWSAIAISVADGLGQKLKLEATTGILRDWQGREVAIHTSITGRIFRQGQTEVVPDVNADPDVFYVSDVLQQGLFVPLKQSGQRLGILTILLERGERPLTHDDIQLAESLADAIALILDKARLYSNTRRYANDLNSLYRITSTLSQTLMQDNVLSETLRATLTALGFVGGILAVKRNGRLSLETHRYLPEHIAEELVPALEDQTELVTIPDIQRETLTPYTALLQEYNMRTCVLLPLKTQNQLLGGVLLCHLEPRDYTVSHQSLYLSIGRQIATALSNTQLFQEVILERSRLQALIESSRDGILFMGLDQQVLVLNEPALIGFHLSPVPALWVGQSITNLLARLPSDEVRAQLEEEIPYNAPPIQMELTLYNRTFEWVSLPVQGGERPLGRLWVFYDITESRLLEQMRDDLMHTTVHDLRNPLLAQATALDMVNTANPEQEEIVEVMRTSVNRMLTMVNTMLDINRLESQQMPIRFTILSIPMLVEAVLQLQETLIQQKELDIQIYRPTTVPFAYGDDSLIERVLQNLIDNAIKFTPSQGQLTITMTVNETELQIAIFNEGSYISPDLETRLFQKFITGNHQKRGSGLGLAFCRMVIEAHDKEIWLESHPEAGTTFFFTLALASQDLLGLV